MLCEIWLVDTNEGGVDIEEDTDLEAEVAELVELPELIGWPGMKRLASWPGNVSLGTGSPTSAHATNRSDYHDKGVRSQEIV